MMDPLLRAGGRARALAGAHARVFRLFVFLFLNFSKLRECKAFFTFSSSTFDKSRKCKAFSFLSSSLFNARVRMRARIDSERLPA